MKAKTRHLLFATLVVLAGVGVGCTMTLHRFGVITATYDLITAALGSAPYCGWSEILLANFRAAVRLYREPVSVRQLRRDPSRRFELVGTANREFWFPATGGELPPTQLLAFLLTEQNRFQTSYPQFLPRKGDIVLDCGAHVGTFTDLALRLGSAKVIAIEPEPDNLECLRRNFSAEIGSDRVVLLQRGVWDSEGTLTLKTSAANSGMNSAVLPYEGKAIQIPVSTIDRIVYELRLPKVDYVKIDIEGAEKQALLGAKSLISRHKPRLFVESLHYKNEAADLIATVKSLASYETCATGPCNYKSGTFVPLYVAWE